MSGRGEAALERPDVDGGRTVTIVGPHVTGPMTITMECGHSISGHTGGHDRDGRPTGSGTCRRPRRMTGRQAAEKESRRGTRRKKHRRFRMCEMPTTPTQQIHPKERFSPEHQSFREHPHASEREKTRARQEDVSEGDPRNACLPCTYTMHAWRGLTGSCVPPCRRPCRVNLCNI